MNQKEFAALPDVDSKILLYFSLILNQELPTFDLELLRESTQLNTEFLFKHIKYLANIGLLNSHLDERSAKLYLIVFGGSIDLRVIKWSRDTIKLWNEIVLEYDTEIMVKFVNYLYNPLGLYDHETMHQFLDIKMIQSVKSASEVLDTFTEEKQKDKKIRANLRAERRKRAKYLTKTFYDILNEKVMIYPTSQLIETESKEMVELLKRYPECPNELIIEGIRFFRDNEFWSPIIVSIKSLTKHFAKFLSNEKGMKKTSDRMKLL